VQFFTKADLNRLERMAHRQPERLRQALSALAQQTVIGRTDVFANLPFRRVALLAALDQQLGSPAIARCCLDERGMPPPVDDEVASHHSTDAAQKASLIGEHNLFHRYCDACHHGADDFPPNFLHGSPDEVKANLTQCADRIFVRLRMWDIAGPEQLEAPMPPALHLLHHRFSLDQWKSHPDLQVLRKEAVAAIQRKRGATFTPEDLLRQDYDTLPACLAPSHEMTGAVAAHHG